jgi:hypothetical protein
MKHLEIRRNVLKLLWLLQSEDQQAQYYDSQKNAINAIRNKEGFNHIITYREVESDNALQMLWSKSTPIDEIRYWQAKYDQSIQFLDFLERMKI